MPAEYYARTAAAAAAIGLPRRDPLTGHEVRIDEVPDAGRLPPLSCLEMLRLPLARDGYLWRRDAGGALLALGAMSASASALVEQQLAAKEFKFRVARGIPIRLLLSSLPPLVYARVVVGGLRDEGNPAGPPGSMSGVDFVDLCSDREGGSDSTNTTASRIRRLVVSASPPTSDLSSSDRSYWLPAGPGAPFGCSDATPPHWGAPLGLAILSSQLQRPCPMLTPTVASPGGGELLLHRFVATYAAVRRLGSKVFVTAPPGEGGRTGELVLIDTRPNVWSVLSVLVTLDNLRAAEWSVAVFCAESNLDFMRSCLLRHVPHARVEALPELSSKASAFDVEEYNVLLKSPAFWARMRSDRVLIVQDDSMLVRPGLDDEAELLAQDYVGAPWVDTPDNRRQLEAAGVGPALVGNGGISLRRVETMRRICEEDGSAGRRLFNSNLQPVPEDVFFAAAVARRVASGELSGASGTRLVLECPRSIAARLAFEEVLPEASVVPLGFHKPWPYVPAAAVAAFFDVALAEARARGAPKSM